jgi:hypothetical protein
MKGGATLSEDRKYRYALWRAWDQVKPHVLFVGLNPSTADETVDDPTVRRCIAFARGWGYGGVHIVNLFALRATDPEHLTRDADPIGPENDRWIRQSADAAALVICAWGNGGLFGNRGTQVLHMLENAYYLQMNSTGQPAHPLYLRGTLHPKPFRKQE